MSLGSPENVASSSSIKTENYDIDAPKQPGKRGPFTDKELADAAERELSRVKAELATAKEYLVKKKEDLAEKNAKIVDKKAQLIEAKLQLAQKSEAFNGLAARYARMKIKMENLQNESDD